MKLVRVGVAVLAVALALGGAIALGIHGLGSDPDEEHGAGAEADAKQAYVRRQQAITGVITAVGTPAETVDRLRAFMPYTDSEELRVLNLLRTYRALEAEAIVRALVAADERLRDGWMGRWLKYGVGEAHMMEPR